MCTEHYFEKDSIIKFYVGGRESGGNGGQNCGWNKGKGYNGGGRAEAKFGNEFLIVGGGGGGDSESGNKGGNFEEDGEGWLNGYRASNKTFGMGGGTYSEDGKKDKGGNGASSDSKGMYCGGGGGDGYYGGGAGGYGEKGKDGGGGGGSNFCCKTAYHCFNSELSNKEYAGYEIYKKVK